MAKYEFKFVVTDVELSDAHQDRIRQEISRAGALALGDVTPPEAVSLQFRNILWRGIPPVEILKGLESFVEASAARE